MLTRDALFPALRVFLCLVGLSVHAPSQSLLSQSLLVDYVPVGRAPLGVDTTLFLPNDLVWNPMVAVANSGDDSISLLKLEVDSATRLYRLAPFKTVRGVPSPYAVAGCFLQTDRVLVTSPSAGTVSVIRPSDGTLLGSIFTGFQPYSVACTAFGVRRIGLVSLANDSLAILDLDSLTITASVRDVPYAQSLRGIAAVGGTAWVAGTAAGVVTIVDLSALEIVVKSPLAATAVRCCYPLFRGSAVVVATDEAFFGFNTFTHLLEFTVRGMGKARDVAFWSTGSSRGIGASLHHYEGLSLTPTPDGPVEQIPLAPDAAGIATWLYVNQVVPFENPRAFVVAGTFIDNLYLIQMPPPPRYEFTVSDAAPGSLATIFVRNTGLTTPLTATPPLPTTLGGLKVRIGGSLVYQDRRWTYSSSGAVPAPVLYANSTQANFQVPPATAPTGGMPLELERPDGSKLLGHITVLAVRPMIFNRGILNDDNSLVGFPNPAFPGARPAIRGRAIQIFASGAGATEPELGPGEAAPASGNPLVRTRIQPTVEIGRRNARVLFSGMAPGLVGVWQINAEVPPDAVANSIDSGGREAVSLIIRAAGVTSNNMLFAVQ